MKVMKTLKTLKFWSRKKKKKKSNNNHHHSAPPCCYCHQHDGSQTVVQPSAPPLPSWLDYEEQSYNQYLLASEMKFDEFQGLPISHEAQFEDDTSNALLESGVVNLSASGDLETGSSYQQYMVENPVHGVPVLPWIKAERSAGAVGCVFNIGAHIFRCFFPCFRIRDV